MALTTGSPQDNQPSSWPFSSGNRTSGSFSKTIFGTGRSSIRSSCPLRVLPASSQTLRTMPSESLCTWTTFAMGHWLWLASILKSKISRVKFSLILIPLHSCYTKLLPPSLPKFISYVLNTSPTPPTEFISSYKFTWWWNHYFSLHG